MVKQEERKQDERSLTIGTNSENARGYRNAMLWKYSSSRLPCTSSQDTHECALVRRRLGLRPYRLETDPNLITKLLV